MQDRTSEQEVIQHTVMTGEILPLDVDDFVDPVFRSIWNTIKTLEKNQVSITTKGVIESIKDEKVKKVLTTILLKDYLKKDLSIRVKSLKEYKQKREIQKTLTYIDSLVQDPTQAAQFIAERGIEKFKEIARLRTGGRNWTQEVRDLLAVTSGNISVTNLYNLLQAVTSNEKTKVRQIVFRMEKDGILEKTGRTVGEYRVIDSVLDEIDWYNADTNETPFVWPLGIGNHYRLMPRNIITIAGETDAGKTALALNILSCNMEQYKKKFKYFSSEMGESELRFRIEQFGYLDPPYKIEVEAWRGLKFYDRVTNFHDVIDPNAFNIIDYMHLSEDFYKVGKYINDIWERLDKGIAIILLQKKKGAQYGYGAELTVQKARLSVNLEVGYPYHRAILNKVKNWRDPINNPNGLEIEYKLLRGCWFQTHGHWERPMPEPKGAVNEQGTTNRFTRQRPRTDTNPERHSQGHFLSCHYGEVD